MKTYLSYATRVQKMMIKVLLSLTLVLSGAPSHSETTHEHDKILNITVNEATLRYWSFKSMNEAAKYYSSKLSGNDRKFFLKGISTLKKLPTVGQYEHGLIISYDGIVLRTDLRSIRNNVLFINDKKIVLDPTAPLSIQTEIIVKRIFSDEAEFSLLDLLLPRAYADEIPISPLVDQYGRPLPSAIPKAQAPKGKWYQFKKPDWLKGGIATGATLYVIQLAKDSLPDVSAFIKNQVVGGSINVICWTVVKNETIKSWGACADYLKRIDEELGKNPASVAIKNALQKPQPQDIFSSTYWECPHKTNGKFFSLVKVDLKELRAALLSEIEKPKDGDSANKGTAKDGDDQESTQPVNRRLEVRAEVKDQKTKKISVKDRSDDSFVANYLFTDQGSFEKIEIPNPEREEIEANPPAGALKVTQAISRRLISPTVEVPASESVPAGSPKREQDRKVHIKLYNHIASILKICSGKEEEDRNLQKANQVQKSEKAAK